MLGASEDFLLCVFSCTLDNHNYLRGDASSAFAIRRSCIPPPSCLVVGPSSSCFFCCGVLGVWGLDLGVPRMHLESFEKTLQVHAFFGCLGGSHDFCLTR